MSNQLQIGELARQAGVNPKTIRYYEEIGLLPAPVRAASGYRLYSAADVTQVEFIRRAQLLDFSLGEIKEILACRARGQAPCAYVRHLIHDKLAEVERRIEELQQLHKEHLELEQSTEQEPIPQDVEPGQICHILERRV